jgi:predicted ATP-grasp superfamily ATP-dependent carboligase
MVEFKQDQRDGVAKLMEINGRFWGSLQLAIDAGVDFPELLVRIGDGAPIPAVENYRLGVRSRWFLGDVDALLMRLLKSGERLKLPPDQRSRWKAMREFLRPTGAVTRSEIFRFSDWRPGLLEAWRWLRHR